MRRNALAVGLVCCFVLAFAGAALASHLANHSLYADTTGAKFDGTWEWYSSSEGNGGWHFWGTLTDTGSGDGDNVYSKVKVEGYTPNSFYGDEAGDGVNSDGWGTGAEEWQNYEVYDYQALTTRRAEYWACRDRNAPLSDNCSDENNLFTR